MTSETAVFVEVVTEVFKTSEVVREMSVSVVVVWMVSV